MKYNKNFDLVSVFPYINKQIMIDKNKKIKKYLFAIIRFIVFQLKSYLLIIKKVIKQKTNQIIE